MASPLWSLEQGLFFIDHIQRESFLEDFYICLAGGVLNRRYSNNDLDLVAVNNAPSSDYKRLKATLDKILQRTSTVKLINNRVHLKWESLKVECLVIEKEARETL